MHELSLCEGILQLIEEQAGAQRFERVTAVWLEIGELAGVDAEAIRFCFEVVGKGSIADGARLEIIQRTGSALCMSCGREVRLSRRFDACPDCGNYPLQITGGEELRVKELEVEQGHNEQ